MEKIDALSQLDNVLTYLASQQNPTYQSIHEIRKELDNSYTTERLNIILDKLYQDGYASLKEEKGYNTIEAMATGIPKIIKTYTISFEGALFYELVGGYVKQTELNRAENKRLEAVEAFQREQAERLNALTQRLADNSTQLNTLTDRIVENSSFLNRLTLWIVIGAIISSAYYLYYLIIPIYDHFVLKKP
jgi:hypothetical protein